MVHLQDISQEEGRGRGPRGRWGRWTRGGSGAPEEQRRPIEENEEQDGGESHGPCLPSILLSLLRQSASLFVICPMSGKVYQDPTLAGSC